MTTFKNIKTRKKHQNAKSSIIQHIKARELSKEAEF